MKQSIIAKYFTNYKDALEYYRQKRKKDYVILKSKEGYLVVSKKQL